MSLVENVKYDYYISSRFRNKDAILDLVSKIRAKGKTVYVFLESHASRTHVGELDTDAEQAMKEFENIADWKTDPRVREVFETDMQALKNSETVIVLLPAGKSTHIEAGVAYGLGKKLILIGEQKETETLYLIFDEFYSSVEGFIVTIR